MSERKLNNQKAPPKFTEYNNLCSERNGGKILFSTDDWFAVAENLIKSEEPQWKEGEFTECGKWMDGWETRRKRTAGHDWAIIKLGVPGVFHGVCVDTAFFTGNYAPRFSLQAASLTESDEELIPSRESRLGSAASTEMMKNIADLKSECWEEVVPVSELNGGYCDTRHNYFTIDTDHSWSHVRLNIYPDGGIARLHLYGEARRVWEGVDIDKMVDLVSMVNGGVCMGYSDAHYGHPRNLIRPGRGINMGDGWETARRLDRPLILEADEEGMLQVPGCEWVIFRLGHCGSISLVEVDTNHFKGNFPDSVGIEGAFVRPCNEWGSTTRGTLAWKTLLPLKKLSPHKQHFFSENDLRTSGPFTHVRVTIAPDGGISRLRLWGFL